MISDRSVYYDPRSGEAITADEWVKRYTVNAFQWVERDRAPITGTADAPGLKQFGARCPGCGTAVEVDGVPCPMCEDKPQFQAPKAMLILDAQPAPAYRLNVED